MDAMVRFSGRMQAGIENIIAACPTDPTPAPRQPDWTLARLAARAATDDEAFEALYRRLGGGVRRFLIRRGIADSNRLEELAQLVWVDVWQALRTGRYDPHRAAITTFLYAVAYKVWLQHRRLIRAATAREAEPSALERVADETEPVVDALSLAEQIETVRCCLADASAAGLSAEEHAVLRGLCDGETERSLAGRLGVAASTIHARKSSAFHKLRQHIDLRASSRETAERRPAADG
jgi:RNA polymerase sigma factor (sigma-70 family)